jgi:signal peptidase II
LNRALTALPPALAACGAVVAIDQGSKALATSLVARGDREEVLPFLAFQNTRNRGIAFGLAGDVSALLIAAMLVGLLALLVFLASRATNGTALWLAAGLLVGGALGNLADRVRDGAVTDFIDLPLWPTFNLADLAIVAGVLLLVLAVDERAGPDDAA